MFRPIRQAIAKVMCWCGEHRTYLKQLGPNIGMECVWCGKYLAWLPSRVRLLKQPNGKA